ncbi:MAG: hypothetical protein WDZ63_05380 [Burkholderiales bacterium]
MNYPYTAVAIALHCLIAFAIPCNIALGMYMAELWRRKANSRSSALRSR